MLVFIGIIIGSLALSVLVFFLLSRKKGEKKPKQSLGKKEWKKKADINAEVNRVEKLNFKKCRACGENVPKDDNICQSCSAIP